MNLIIKETLKKIFPIPRIPQRRYLILILSIILMGFELYSEHYRDPYDEEILDRAHKIALNLLDDNSLLTFMDKNCVDNG